MNTTPTIETSPLLQAIASAIRENHQTALGIRVSMSPEAEWYLPKNESGRYLVKWLCWNLIDGDRKEITEPQYVVVHGELDQITVEKGLADAFPRYTVVVDNDIEMQ